MGAALCLSLKPLQLPAINCKEKQATLTPLAKGLRGNNGEVDYRLISQILLHEERVALFFTAGSEPFAIDLDKNKCLPEV